MTKGQSHQEGLPAAVQAKQDRRSCRCITTSTTNVNKSANSPTNKEAVAFPFKAEESVALPVVVTNKLKKLEGSEKFKSVGSSQPSELGVELAPNIEISETDLSINDSREKLPLVSPREHGSFCAIEINVLEKHVDSCFKKKQDVEGRHPMEDKVGSYDVISRLVYRTCTGSDGDSTIRNSAKGFRLNDPDAFGKELRECRSRVETVPLLPFLDTCTLKDHLGPQAVYQLQSDSPYKTIFPKEMPESAVGVSQKPPEVLSVYVRTDRNKKVPDGFQKMHYRGDSCKLHDPTERSKQILALQKVIAETSSAAEVSRSIKTFSSGSDVRVMSAAVAGPMQLPKTIFAPPPIMKESEESLISYKHLHGQEPDTDSAESLLPPRRVVMPNEDHSKKGIFGKCFKRNKHRREDAQVEEERYYRARNIVHNENRPKKPSQTKETQSNRKEYSLHGGKLK